MLCARARSAIGGSGTLQSRECRDERGALLRGWPCGGEADRAPSFSTGHTRRETLTVRKPRRELTQERRRSDSGEESRHRYSSWWDGSTMVHCRARSACPASGRAACRCASRDGTCTLHRPPLSVAVDCRAALCLDMEMVPSVVCSGVACAGCGLAALCGDVGAPLRFFLHIGLFWSFYSQ